MNPIALLTVRVLATILSKLALLVALFVFTLTASAGTIPAPYRGTCWEDYWNCDVYNSASGGDWGPGDYSTPTAAAQSIERTAFLNHNNPPSSIVLSTSSFVTESTLGAPYYLDYHVTRVQQQLLPSVFPPVTYIDVGQLIGANFSCDPTSSTKVAKTATCECKPGFDVRPTTKDACIPVEIVAPNPPMCEAKPKLP